MSNPNAFAAALTSFFVWLLSGLAAHFHLVAITPDRILAAAGACTFAILWIGHDGIRGAVRRLWDGVGTVVNGQQEPEQPAKKAS